MAQSVEDFLAQGGKVQQVTAEDARKAAQEREDSEYAAYSENQAERGMYRGNTISELKGGY